LWIARKRAGYPQKVVARLLGNRSLSIVSEYERGRKLPSLRTALKLELMYKTPLAQLYPGLYADAVRDLSSSNITRYVCR
jgi:transcriptional regulator with XRE-family HTH domain